MADDLIHPMPRWYMVNNYGAATLCVDKADAQRESTRANAAYPNHSPHSAVQLVNADALARKDAEIAELRAGIVKRDDDVILPMKLYRDMEEADAALRQRAERAEARVREAPVARVERWAGAAWVLHKCGLAGVYPPIAGKRVALVLLDTEE